MARSKKIFIAGISIILVLVVLLGCLPNKQGGFTCIAAPLLSKIQSMLPTPKKAGQSAVAGTGPTRPHPPVRTGDITTGSKVQAASQSINSSGGTVFVTKPGDPLDGFVIDVPPASYSDSRTFKVSSAPITNQTFGSDINPISPMITVDNGGGYADELMYVRVPVKVPEDSFAMGFMYDEKTKQLEGMPLVGSDDESVTVATMHFSNFFISMIEKALLKNDIDSGFRPGIDDWQFTNYGSYIAPKGHCEGQALTAMWYYCTQPDGNGACLYGRYDNNGNKPATPDLWQDDSLGYRFCSVVQNETRFGADVTVGDATLDDFWNNLAGKCWDKANHKWVDCPAIIGDETEFNLFAYSIRATGEPQEVGMRSNAGGGHAMIVYKIVGNALYVADPNYYGNTDRKIIYYSGDGKFKPYNSGANKKEIDAGHGEAYERIIYAAKSTIVPWDVIAKRWTEFKAGTIGNDKFPKYTLTVVDGKGATTPLTDGFATANKMLRIAAAPLSCHIYRDGALLPVDASFKFELKPGNNLLGVCAVGKVGEDFEYVDFKSINVNFDDGKCKTPPPDKVLAQLQKTTKFKCTFIEVPCTVEASGSMIRWIPGSIKSRTFIVPSNANYADWETFAAIKWSGTSFSSAGTGQGYTDKLTGNVCYSGSKVLVSFDYEMQYADQGKNQKKTNTYKISAKDVPLNDPQNRGEELNALKVRPGLWQYNLTGSHPVNGFITRLEWAGHEEENLADRLQTWDYKMTEWHSSDSCGPDLMLWE